MRRASLRAEKRGLTEKFYGRCLTEREAVVAVPEDNEALALRPRISEQPWELSAMRGLELQRVRLVHNEEVQYLVGEARRLLFGDNRVPFRTLGEAGWWIHQELSKSKLTPADLHRLKARLERKLPSEARIGFWRVWLPAQEAMRPIAEALGIKGFPSQPRTEHLLDAEFFEAPGELCVRASTKKLRILAEEAGSLAELFGWTSGQATALILADEQPTNPRFRLWNNAVGTRVIIECLGSVSRREILELHRLIRENTGTKRLKSFTFLDLELIEFVETNSGMSWPDRLIKWNKLNRKRRFARESSLQNAYKRAKSREGRP